MREQNARHEVTIVLYWVKLIRGSP